MKPEKETSKSMPLNGDQLYAYCEKELILHTRDIRKKPHEKCGGKLQACHIVGLNLIKQLYNAYGLNCRKFTAHILAQTIVELNDESNFYCCTVEQNNGDKVTEKEVLEFIFHHTALITEEAREMYTKLRSLLERVQEKMRKNGYANSSTIRVLLNHYVPALTNKTLSMKNASKTI